MLGFGEMKRIKIVEKEGLRLDSPIVIEGLPDVGLVGAIAVSHLAEELKLQEVAHLESDLFPPIMVLHKGEMMEPVRILGNTKLLLIISEIALPPIAIYELSEELTEWIKGKGASLLVSLTGIPVQNRMNIDAPKVYGVGNGDRALGLLRESGIEVMEEGFIAGLYALMMRECKKRDLPALALMAQSFLNYPDPGAAAAALQALNRLLGMQVSVQPLLDKAAEIRLKARDLMKQAQRSMEAMRKVSEQEIPLMYH